MTRTYRTLRECTSTGSVSYGIVQPGKHVEDGVPIVRVNNINNGTLDVTDPLKVDPAIDEKHRKTRLKGGEVLLSLVGTTGQCVVAGPELKGWNVARAIAVIKPAEGIDADWLTICLKSPETQHYLDSRANTTVQKTLNLSDVREIPILTVPDDEERYILEWWNTLNDKIELNRRMNATLEGMAQALFKSWFVDFDPVIDNALAADNPIPDEFAERAKVRQQILEKNKGDSLIPDTALRDSATPKSEGTPQVTSEARNKLAPRAEVRKKALANGTSQQGSLDHPTLSDPKSLFPDAFKFTEELGWIPEGWETQPLYDIADFVNGAAYKGADFSDAEDALPVIKIAEVKAGITAQTKFTTINKGDKYRIEDGDILLSWSGNPDTSIDTFIWANDPGYLNQHIFNVRLYDESERHFVYYQLKYLRSTFAEIARDKQTTGLGHFTAGDMKRLMVFKPTTSVLEQFNAAVSSIYSRAYENRIATKMLTKLRDALLPKLISGEIRT